MPAKGGCDCRGILVFIQPNMVTIRDNINHLRDNGENNEFGSVSEIISMMSAAIKSQRPIEACVKIRPLFLLQFVIVIYIARVWPGLVETAIAYM